MNLQGGFRLPCQSRPPTCCGSSAFRRPAGNPVGMSRSRTWSTGQGTGPILATWVTVFPLGDHYSSKPGRVSMASPYGPPASDAFHKHLNNQSLVPNQSLDSADPDSYHCCCFHSFGADEEEVVRGPHRPGSGPTVNGVAFSGRGGGGSRRDSGCGTGAQPERRTLRETGCVWRAGGPCEAGQRGRCRNA